MKVCQGWSVPSPNRVTVLFCCALLACLGQATWVNAQQWPSNRFPDAPGFPTTPSGVAPEFASASHIRVGFLQDQGLGAPDPASTGNIQSVPIEERSPVVSERQMPLLPYQQGYPEELLPRPVSDENRAQMARLIPEIIDPQQELNLNVGQPRILTFAEWATEPQVRLYLADENICRWDIISDTEVAVVGLQQGTTVLTIWFNDPSTESGKRVLSFRVRVFEDPMFQTTLKELEHQISELFPDSHVKLSIVRDRLVVSGQAKDSIEAGQILTILAQTRNDRSTSANPKNPSTIVYSDRDPLQDEDDAAERRAAYDLAAINQAGIINLLTIPGEQQVTLHVTLAEVNRSALRSIGTNVEIGGSGDVSFVSLLMPNGFAASSGGNLEVNNPDFRLALNALRDLGFARTLAEPNLTALNGQTASFRAGDTFPVPNAQAAFGGVGQSVSQQFVGVDVQFVPYIVDRDRIRLRVRGQVSARDDEQTANIAGTNVPGQNTRDFFTTVELRDGQTLALAGLLQTTLVGESSGVPLLGDIPVLGTLFNDKSNTATEQELVILVTPVLTHPLDDCEGPPLPGSDVFEPTDNEFFLRNRIESRRLHDFRSPVRTDLHRIQQAEECCPEQYIIGPSGHCYGNPRTSDSRNAALPSTAVPRSPAFPLRD